MVKMILANKQELEVVRSVSTSQSIDGVVRQVLTININPENTSLDQVDTVLSSAANLSKFKLVNDAVETPVLEADGTTLKRTKTGEVQTIQGSVETLMEDFTRVELSKKAIAVDTDEYGVPIVEDQIVVVLAKKSPMEKKLDEVVAVLKNAGMMN